MAGHCENFHQQQVLFLKKLLLVDDEKTGNFRRKMRVHELIRDSLGLYLRPPFILLIEMR